VDGPEYHKIHPDVLLIQKSKCPST